MLALSSPESEWCAEGDSELMRETMAAAKDMMSIWMWRGEDRGSDGRRG